MPINTTGNMLMDARVLPDGSVVGRDDPRFFDVGLQSNPAARGSDEWTRRVRNSVTSLRPTGFASSGVDPSTSNLALRPGVRAVRNALYLKPPGGSTTPPPPTKPPVLPGQEPGGKPPTPIPFPKDPTTPPTGANPLTPGTPPAPPGTTGGRLPSGDTSGGQNPLMPGTGASAPPTTGPNAPGYGSADNPAWQTFLGGYPGGSATEGWQDILDARAAGQGNLPWTPHDPAGGPPKGGQNDPGYTPLPASANFFHGSTAEPGTMNVGLQSLTAQDHPYDNMLKDGGRVGKRKKRLGPVTINGRAMTVTDGTANGDDAVGYADGGMVDPIGLQPQPPVWTNPVMPPAVQPPVATTPVMPPGPNNPLTPPIYAGADDTGGGYHLPTDRQPQPPVYTDPVMPPAQEPQAPVYTDPVRTPSATPMPKPQPAQPMPKPQPSASGTAQPFTPQPGQFRPGGTAAPAPPDTSMRTLTGQVLKFADGGRTKESGDYSLWNQILNGRPSFGETGFDIMNALAAAQGGGPVDPRLAQYFDMTPREGGGFNFQPREGTGVGAQGHIQRNGRNYVQMGGVPDDERVLNRDPSQFEVDPRFGLLTGAENVHIEPTWLDRYSPYLVAAGFGGAALGAAMGGGAGAALESGTGAFDAGIGLDTMAGGPWAGGEAAGVGTGAYDAGIGLDTMGGGPVIDESAGLNMNSIPPEQVQQIAANPAVQQQAASAGQSVTQWLSNPRNLLSAARLAGTVLSLGGAGSRAGSQVPGVPNPGSGAPGTGAPGTSVNPAIAAGATGGADANFDWERYFSDNPTANWQSVRGQFAPITDLILNEASTAGNANEQEAAAGRASADVMQRTGRADEARRAAMISQGINPYDPRGVGGEVARMSHLDTARADVGGQNAARLAERNRGFAVRTAAANLGNAQGAQALTADNVGLQSATTRARLGSDVANQNANRRYQYTALGQQGDIARGNQDIARSLANNTIASGNSSRNAADRTAAGVGLNSIYNIGRDIFSGSGGRFDGGNVGDENYWTMFNKDGGRIDAKKAGKARIKRNYRDGARVEVSQRRDFDSGGEVNGPGTSTSDSVRAQLSDGEHVLNAEAVELMDADNPGALDDLNKKGLMVRAVRERMRNIGLEA